MLHALFGGATRLGSYLYDNGFFFVYRSYRLFQHYEAFLAIEYHAYSGERVSFESTSLVPAWWLARRARVKSRSERRLR